MKDTLDELIPLIHQKEDNSFLREQLAKYEKFGKISVLPPLSRGKEEKIQPEYVISVVDELSSDDAIFTVDTGMTCVWGARYLQATGMRKMLGSFNHGSDGERHAASDRGGIGLSRQASRGVVW